MRYFDNNATLPLLAEAKNAWLEAQEKYWFNASSPTMLGASVRVRLDAVRTKISSLLNRGPECIVFTSGATESNNTAAHIFGVFLQPATRIGLQRIQHASVLLPFKKHFSDQVQCFDRIDELKSHGGLFGAVIVSGANSESGEIYPLSETIDYCRKSGSWLFCDATQLIGKTDSWESLGECHFVTGSAHKFGGPKGVGFLAIPSGISMTPLISGGGQQEGKRSGTENYPSIFAMSEALTVAESQKGKWKELECSKLLFERRIQDLISGSKVIADSKPRLWNTSLILVPKYENTNWVSRLEKKGFIIGTGSACSSHKESSNEDTGFSQDERKRLLRFSGNFFQSTADWDDLGSAVLECWNEFNEEKVHSQSQVIDI
jgi:cysteine desulfurase